MQATVTPPEQQIDQALTVGALQYALQLVTSAQQLQPNNAALAHRYGVTLQRLNRTHEAFGKFNQALTLNPLAIDTRLAIAQAYLATNDSWTATAWISDACRVAPNEPALWMELTQTLASHQREAELEPALRSAVAANPQSEPLLHALADYYLQKKRHTDAASIYTTLQHINSHNAQVHLRLGFCLEQLQDLPGCISAYRQALALDAANVDVLVHLAGVLWRLGNFEGTLVHAQEALRLAPNNPNAVRAWGTALLHINRLDEAETHIRRALELQPDFPIARIDLALLLLLAGKFEAGWQAYERRWQDTDRMTRPAFFDPELEWKGPVEQPVAGKRVVIYAEQGLGDVINFVRYAAVLQADGATVTCVIQPELVPLVESMAGVICLKPHLNIEADYHVALLELPLHYRTDQTNTPANTPYFAAPLDKVQAFKQKLNPWDGKLKVGIAWTGNPVHANHHNRSMPLSEFAPILAMPGVQCFSLQKSDGGVFTDVVPNSEQLVDFTGDWADFADSAAMIECLDLVISIDSSVVHLAGALNKPVWLMLPPNPDWRWLLERTTSAWYPSMTLYRWHHAEAKSSQVARVAADLQTLAAQRGATNV